MCLYTWVRCPQRPEDGVGIPVARVIGSYEPPNVGTGTEVRFFARAVLTVNDWAISAFIHVFLYDTPACDVTKTDSRLPSRFLTSLSPQCAVSLLKNIPNTERTDYLLAGVKQKSKWELGDQQLLFRVNKLFLDPWCHSPHQWSGHYHASRRHIPPRRKLSH